jgi:predicted CoA-binding protein
MNMYEFKNPSEETINGYLKHAQTIALVGISDKADRPSYQVATFLYDQGYHILPVNRRLAGKKLFGETVVSQLTEISGHIDIVDVFRRSEALPDVAREFLQSDADVFWAQLGLQSEEAEQILRAPGFDKIVMNRCTKIDFKRMTGRD